MRGWKYRSIVEPCGGGQIISDWFDSLAVARVNAAQVAERCGVKCKVAVYSEARGRVYFHESKMVG